MWLVISAAIIGTLIMRKLEPWNKFYPIYAIIVVFIYLIFFR